MRNPRVIAGVTGLALVCCFASGCSILPEEETFETTALVKEYEGTEFSMTNVRRGDVCEYNKVVCKYSESNIQDIELEPWIPIKKIHVKKGQKVKSGDVLITVVAGDIDEKIAEYEYQIKMKETQISQARHLCELEVKRQKELMDDKVAIRAIEERYDADISNLTAELEVQKTGLEQALEEREDFEIKATIDGTVTYVDNHIAKNSSGSEGEAFGFMNKEKKKVVSISDGSMPRFTGSIDTASTVSKETTGTTAGTEAAGGTASAEGTETVAGSEGANNKIELEEGQEINVVCNNKEYKTRVQYMNSSTVAFVFDYVPDDLETGASGYAKDIVDERKDVLYLPKSAISKMGDKDIVYCEDSSGFKVPVEVEVGLVADGKAEIVSGLNEGDAVIVR